MLCKRVLSRKKEMKILKKHIALTTLIFATVVGLTRLGVLTPPRANSLVISRPL